MVIKLKDPFAGAMKNRNLIPFHLYNLVEVLQNLHNDGYYYSAEERLSDKFKSIWDDPENRPENFLLTDDWLNLNRQHPVTAIRMTFEHFLTRKKIFLHIRREKISNLTETVMWSSYDSFDIFSDSDGGLLVGGNMPPLFQKLLAGHKLLTEPSVFHKFPIYALSDKANKSLFCLLYQCEFCQLREGWLDIGNPEDGEEIRAWAGEFFRTSDSPTHREYLYLSIFQRIITEWDSNYGGEKSLVWREKKLDFYTARSREPLDSVQIMGEPRINLQKLDIAEQLETYLENFHKLDFSLS